jgi:outer membrane protein OmpA-like peptidoglycan-associated protein
MNAFGVICRILLAISFCLAPLAVAQQARPTSLDLVYKSLDLESPVRELKAESENLQGSSKTAVAEARNLVAPATGVSVSPSQLVSPAMEVKESATEVKINLLGDILFDFDKATIRPVAEPTLAQVAALIRKYPNSTVLIEGHTDGKGSETYNLKLSEKRANSVSAWLAAHGIAEGTMRTAGWGAARPVAPNRKPNGADDPEGRQKNRRVEITVKK